MNKAMTMTPKMTFKSPIFWEEAAAKQAGDRPDPDLNDPNIIDPKSTCLDLHSDHGPLYLPGDT
jgi:hypothetical protein